MSSILGTPKLEFGMAGKATAVKSGDDIERVVASLGEELELLVERKVVVGRRIWGSKRQIDVVLKHPQTRVSLGVECKFQGVSGSAEE
jgi:hypothetical protein